MDRTLTPLVPGDLAAVRAIAEADEPGGHSSWMRCLLDDQGKFVRWLTPEEVLTVMGQVGEYVLVMDDGVTCNFADPSVLLKR